MASLNDVHPKVAQQQVKHSDIRLTMNFYTHTQISEVYSAVQRLPLVPMPSKSVIEVPKLSDGESEKNGYQMRATVAKNCDSLTFSDYECQ